MSTKPVAVVEDAPDFTLTFAPIEVPVGGTPTSHWLAYEKLAERGITHITVTPRLTSDIVSFSDENTTYLSLDLDFDDTLWTPDLGLVYGDDAFEKAIQEWANAIGLTALFGAPSYTEQGMQGETYISMEFEPRDGTPESWRAYWPTPEQADAWAASPPSTPYAIAT